MSSSVSVGLLTWVRFNLNSSVTTDVQVPTKAETRHESRKRIKQRSSCQGEDECCKPVLVTIAIGCCTGLYCLLQDFGFMGYNMAQTQGQFTEFSVFSKVDLRYSPLNLAICQVSANLIPHGGNVRLHCGGRVGIAANLLYRRIFSRFASVASLRSWLPSWSKVRHPRRIPWL